MEEDLITWFEGWGGVVSAVIVECIFGLCLGQGCLGFLQACLHMVPKGHHILIHDVY